MSKLLKGLKQVLNSGKGIDIQMKAGNVDVTIYEQGSKDVVCECTHSSVYDAVLEAVQEAAPEVVKKEQEQPAGENSTQSQAEDQEPADE